MTCHGYTKLEKYDEFEKYSKRNSNGAVFKWTPTKSLKIFDSGFGYKNVHLTVMHEYNFQFSANEQTEKPGNLLCVRYIVDVDNIYHRVIIRVQGHGYEDDYVTLDDFGVVTCEEEMIQNMFQLVKDDEYNYTLGFKGTDTKKCFKKKYEVQEYEVEIFVHRGNPSEIDCSKLNGHFEKKKGIVKLEEWMSQYEYLPVVHSIDFELGENVEKVNIYTKIPDYKGNPGSTAKIYLTCRTVQNHGQGFSVVDIREDAFVIDRLITNSCAKEKLDASIHLINHKQKEDNGWRYNSVKIRYNKTMKGKCFERKYYYGFERKHINLTRKSKSKKNCLKQNIKGKK